jgi:hypothetical protein
MASVPGGLFPRMPSSVDLSGKGVRPGVVLPDDLFAVDVTISKIVAGGTKLLRRVTMDAVTEICNVKPGEGAGLHRDYMEVYYDLPKSLVMCKTIFANKELCVEDVHAAILARIVKKNYDNVNALASEMSALWAHFFTVCTSCV